MPCLPILEPPETGAQRIIVPPVAAAGDVVEKERICMGSDLAGSCSQLVKEPEAVALPAESSSIGNNSDEEGESEGENEVQSPLKLGFKASMDSLEEALPMRRGISSFYNGKSKSFTSLTNAAASIKTIVKPESPYSRKRRNVLAHTLLWDHNKTSKTSHLIRAHGGGISKKPALFATSSSNPNTFALAFAIAPSKTNHHLPGLKSRGPGPSPLSPHLMGAHNNAGFCHWRSFSVADLQQCGATVSSNLGSSDGVS